MPTIDFIPRISRLGKNRPGLIFAATLVPPLFLLMHYSLATMQFTVDSWTLWDIASSFDEKIYKIAAIRQYSAPTNYANSFPPLYPFLLWFADLFSKQGIVSGVWINLLAMILTAFACFSLSKNQLSSPVPALLACMTTLTAIPFLEEFQAARTIPLSLLFWVLSWSMLFRFRKEPRNTLLAVKIGIIGGLATLNRFDCLAPSIITLMVTAYLARSFKARLGVGTAFVLVISPWIVYSRLHFGVFWSSENMLLPKLAIEWYPQDYFPPHIVLPNIWNSTVAWILLTIKQCLRALKNLVLLRYMPLATLFYFYYFVRKHGRLSYSALHKAAMLAIRDWGIVALPLVGHFLTILKFGYYQPRYLVPEMFFLVLFLGRIVRDDIFAESKDLLPCAATVSLLFALASMSLRFFVGPYSYHSTAQNDIRGIRLSVTENEVVQAIYAYPGTHQGCLLVLDRIYGARVAALSKISTCIGPSNLTDGNFDDFILHWPVAFVLGESPLTARLHNLPLKVIPIGNKLVAIDRQTISNLPLK